MMDAQIALLIKDGIVLELFVHNIVEMVLLMWYILLKIIDTR